MLFSLNASHRASMASPRMLVTPFSASFIQNLSLKLSELSANSVKWQTGAGDVQMRSWACVTHSSAMRLTSWGLDL